jgi:hypothetical protein
MSAAKTTQNTTTTNERPLRNRRNVGEDNRIARKREMNRHGYQNRRNQQRTGASYRPTAAGGETALAKYNVKREYSREHNSEVPQNTRDDDTTNNGEAGVAPKKKANGGNQTTKNRNREE